MFLSLLITREKVEARLTRVREMKCNPFTLWFLDKKQEQSFSMFSMETNFKAQIIFGILYMILCALFILMDVCYLSIKLHKTPTGSVLHFNATSRHTYCFAAWLYDGSYSGNYLSYVTT